MLAALELAQQQAAAIVQLDLLGRALGVVHLDLLLGLNKAQLLQVHVVLAHGLKGARGAFVVGKGHARRDHVNHGGAPVAQSQIDQGHELFGVAKKGAGHERAAHFQRQRAQVDALEDIDLSALRMRRRMVGFGPARGYG